MNSGSRACAAPTELAPPFRPGAIDMARLRRWSGYFNRLLGLWVKHSSAAPAGACPCSWRNPVVPARELASPPRRRKGTAGVGGRASRLISAGASRSRERPVFKSVWYHAVGRQECVGASKEPPRPSPYPACASRPSIGPGAARLLAPRDASPFAQSDYENRMRRQSLRLFTASRAGGRIGGGWHRRG